MGHCYHHALSSARKWGATAQDYLALHQWFNEPSKLITADFRHRALRHHAEGIFMLERFFGPTITISTGRVVPVRLIGEQHVREDLGFIPGFADWCAAFARSPGWAAPSRSIVTSIRSPQPADQRFPLSTCEEPGRRAGFFAFQEIFYGFVPQSLESALPRAPVVWATCNRFSGGEPDMRLKPAARRLRQRRHATLNGKGSARGVGYVFISGDGNPERRIRP